MFTVAVGSLQIGVRTGSTSLDVGLRAALAAHIVEDGQAPPNYSVRLTEGPGSFHFLYWGGRTVLRTLDPQRLLDGLLTHLSAHAGLVPGRLRANALAAMRGDAALVLPAWLRQELPHFEPLLVRRGFTVADGPWVEIDLATAEVVVEPPLRVHRPALDTIIANTRRKRREPSVPPGRYRIAAWSFLGAAGDAGRLSRAEATMRAITLSSTRVAPASLASLGNFFAAVPGRCYPVGTPTEVVEELSSLLDSDGDGGS